MPSLKIVALFAVTFWPTFIQGQSVCPRTNEDPNKNCIAECSRYVGCSSSKKTCICDGDCGYSCVRKDFRCKKLRSLKNGQRVYNQGRKFNDTVTYTCNSGFTLYGPSVRTCRGIQNWDGIEPKCGKQCPDPGTARNTSRREPIRNSSFAPSDVLHYFCNAGYHIEGKDSIVCKEDGTWDRSPPQCYRTSCPPPALPPNSQIFAPSWFNASLGARNGSKIQLRCDYGYFRTGSSQTMTCHLDKWKLPTSFKCLPKSCGDPGTPTNGGKIGLVYEFKHNVTFYCDKCYKLIGAAYRVCNADRSWSDQNPICEKVETKCKTITSISNGWIRPTPIPNHCGGKVKFSCDRGYKLIGSSSVVCSKTSQWSAEIPRCEVITCPKFNISKMVRSDISGYEYKSTVKFSCKKPGYILSAKDTISCKENGEWSGKIPECLAPCYLKRSNKLVSKESYQHREKADLKCEEGFSLTATIEGEMPLCLNGTWKFKGVKFPYCKKTEDVKEDVKSWWTSWWNSFG